MLTKEQLKEEFLKRVSDLSKHKYEVLSEAESHVMYGVCVWLAVFYDDIVVKHSIDVFKELYQRVTAWRIITLANFLRAVSKEFIEINVNRLCEIFTLLFPQHTWEDVLKTVDKYIDEAIRYALNIIKPAEKTPS